MKKVLITGAGGFVGKYLIKEFKDNGYSVIACDIKKTENIDDDIPYFDMDILNKERIENVFREVMPDYIINLAAISSVGLSWNIPEKTMEVNIIGTINILDAVRKVIPNAKVMLIGSSEEYLESDAPLKEEDIVNANNPYGISKVAAENVAKMYKDKYGLNVVCTRSFNHTGPRTA
ncbi:MAG: SDR family NAD(P)-dependent oxidoreductase [Clostridia bacterium]|nr:SDR family NAD(P)-dependent oxidoreductase [Clostridia bacterium]